MVAANEVDGIVAAVNEKGLKLVGDAAWLNWSRFAALRPALEKGQLVRCVLDGQGFLRAVLPGKASSATARTTESPTDLPAEPALNEPGRDRVITRQWAINAATAILTSGGRQAEPTTVVKLAAQLEVWALRPLASPVAE